MCKNNRFESLTYRHICCECIICFKNERLKCNKFNSQRLRRIVSWNFAQHYGELDWVVSDCLRSPTCATFRRVLYECPIKMLEVQTIIEELKNFSSLSLPLLRSIEIAFYAREAMNLINKTLKISQIWNVIDEIIVLAKQLDI